MIEGMPLTPSSTYIEATLINPMQSFRRDMPPEEGPAELRRWVVSGRYNGDPVEVRYEHETDGSSRRGEQLFRQTYPGGTLIESGLA